MRVSKYTLLALKHQIEALIGNFNYDTLRTFNYHFVIMTLSCAWAPITNQIYTFGPFPSHTVTKFLVQVHLNYSTLFANSHFITECLVFTYVLVISEWLYWTNGWPLIWIWFHSCHLASYLNLKANHWIDKPNSNSTIRNKY